MWWSFLCSLEHETFYIGLLEMESNRGELTTHHENHSNCTKCNVNYIFQCTKQRLTSKDENWSKPGDGNMLWRLSAEETHRFELN